MEVNGNMLEDFRNDFNKIAKILGDKYGMVIQMDSRISYTKDSITASFKAFTVNKDEDGNVADFEKLEFNKLCGRYGYKPEDYRRKVRAGGRIFELVGFKPKARKNKYIIEEDGTKYTCSYFEII